MGFHCGVFSFLDPYPIPVFDQNPETGVGIHLKAGRVSLPALEERFFRDVSPFLKGKAQSLLGNVAWGLGVGNRGFFCFVLLLDLLQLWLKTDL